MLVLAFYLYLSSVLVVATFSGTVLFPLLCSLLPFFPLIHANIDYFLKYNLPVFPLMGAGCVLCDVGIEVLCII